MSRHRSATLILGLIAFLCPPSQGAADPAPVMTYTGDGLTVRIDQWDETAGTLRGQISRGTQTFPFTAKHREEGDAEIVTGAFTSGAQSFDFSTRQDSTTGDAVLFTTGGKTYRLTPAAPAKPDAPKNPLAEDPAPAPSANGQAPATPNAPATAAPAGTSLRLKLHTFPDVTMGSPAAYTALLPPDWTSRGTIEWQPVGQQPFPQLKIEITSPDQGRIRFIPQATMSYSSAPGLGAQGVAPPQDFPRWLVDVGIPQTNNKVANVKLVSSRRDDKAEARFEENDRQTGALPGMQREVHLITIEYDEADLRRREEINMTYVRYPAFNGINGFHSQAWSIFTAGTVSAPADRFDAIKPSLYQAANTVRPTPLWFTQSQAAIAEMSRQRAAANWQAILARGKQISELSDAQFAKYKKETAASDSAQRTRINTIYETDDFRDTTGQTVNLPAHYHHVFSDGNGNYLLTNNSLDKPGESWTPISPAK